MTHGRLNNFVLLIYFLKTASQKGFGPNNIYKGFGTRKWWVLRGSFPPVASPRSKFQIFKNCSVYGYQFLEFGKNMDEKDEISIFWVACPYKTLVPPLALVEILSSSKIQFFNMGSIQLF